MLILELAKISLKMLHVFLRYLGKPRGGQTPHGNLRVNTVLEVQLDPGSSFEYATDGALRVTNHPMIQNW